MTYCFLLKQYRGVTIENRRAAKRTATRSALLYGSFYVKPPYSCALCVAVRFAALRFSIVTPLYCFKREEVVSGPTELVVPGPTELVVPGPTGLVVPGPTGLA